MPGVATDACARILEGLELEPLGRHTDAAPVGEQSLSVIALAAGFADQSHFTRVFRRAFGETPGSYARSLRGR